MTHEPTAWLQRLGNPAIGNVCAALGLVLAIAAGLGLLRREIFWLVFSYLLLLAGLIAVAAVSRRQARALGTLSAEQQTLRNELAETRGTLERTQTKLATAQEDAEASEGGYATLRAAVIQTARWGEADGQDFDDELSEALDKLGHRSVPSAQQQR